MSDFIEVLAFILIALDVIILSVVVISFIAAVIYYIWWCKTQVGAKDAFGLKNEEGDYK
jgi:hypothetical protein